MNEIPRFGDTTDAYVVLGKASLTYNTKDAQPRLFHLKLVWVLFDAPSVHEPGWLVTNQKDIPLEYRTANRYIMAPTYKGVPSEQIAWSDYMRHVEHEMAVVGDNARYHLKQMQLVSDYARAEWIKVQRAHLVADLVPPEISTGQDFTV